MQISLENIIYYFLIVSSSIISMENLENKENIVIYFTSNEKEEKRHIKMDKEAFLLFLTHFILL